MPGRPGLKPAPWAAPRPLCPAAPLMWEPPATPMPPPGICANRAGVTPNNTRTNAERSVCCMVVPRMSSCRLQQKHKVPRLAFASQSRLRLARDDILLRPFCSAKALLHPKTKRCSTQKQSAAPPKNKALVQPKSNINSTAFLGQSSKVRRGKAHLQTQAMPNPGEPCSPCRGKAPGPNIHRAIVPAQGPSNRSSLARSGRAHSG